MAGMAPWIATDDHASLTHMGMIGTRVYNMQYRHVHVQSCITESGFECDTDMHVHVIGLYRHACKDMCC